MSKRIKDPLYGYIEIDDEIFDTIIDTPEFQRLKDIIQTSYTALYPSTLHNRFVHSLGVYHLGRMAAESVCTKCNPEEKSILENYRKAFEMACLLHDVGHAPFSHTGEIFFLDKGKRNALHDELVSLTKDVELKKTIKDRGYKAAPHELMSAIIGIKTYSSSIEEKYFGFFARCITGYLYEDSQENAEILNCFIELLNSKILDVDKIDYLIRDSYMSGADSSSIDYERLLGGISIEPEGDGYTVCYSKAALSVVENVVYAHDLEKKWIQSHPTVLYEAYLIKKTFEGIIEQQFSEYNYLPQEALTEKGLGIAGYGKIRLASDSDMVYLMKNLKTSSSTVEEYLDRRKRKHPIWKTEAEFRAIFFGQTDTMNELKKALKELESSQKTDGIVINSVVLEGLRNDRTDYEVAIKKEKDDQVREQYKATVKKKDKQIELLEVFDNFSREQNIPFDYLVLYTDYFNSGFRKTEFGDMKFKLPMVNDVWRFEDISNVAHQFDSKNEEFFYIFYSKQGESVPSFSSLVTSLISYAGKYWNEGNAASVGNRVKDDN